MTRKAKIFLSIIFIFTLLTVFSGVVLATESAGIPNPSPFGSIGELLDRIFDFLQDIALVVLPLMLVWAGIVFITAGGDPAKIKQAREIVLYAVIGFIIVFLAPAIVDTVSNLVAEP
ncbi:MAG: pilin [Candidatus Pacebacteria bacterium]|nr:pilin [Candidatus Paceibacterota bacterium]